MSEITVSGAVFNFESRQNYISFIGNAFCTFHVHRGSVDSHLLFYDLVHDHEVSLHTCYCVHVCSAHVCWV